MKAREAVFTAVDFESTGSVAGWEEEAWQIGVAEVAGGAPTGVMADGWLGVAAGRPFNPYAPGRHAQVREELAAAEPWALQWGRWKDWFAPGRPLVAHNAATERKFLRKAAPMHRFGPWVDTLALARRALPGRKEYGLGAVCGALGLEAEVAARCPGRTWHDALFDAVAAGVFLSWLLGQEGWRELGVEDLASIR